MTMNGITAADPTNPIVAPLPWTVALCLLSALILATGAAVPGWLIRHPLIVLGWSSLFGGIAAIRLVWIHGRALRRQWPSPPAIRLAFTAVLALLAAHAVVAGLLLWMVSRNWH